MLILILNSLYFFLPAYMANMIPALVAKIPPQPKPISTRYFGTHKTWRGFISGYLIALLTLFIQLKFHNSYNLTSHSLLDYNHINLFFYAFLFGFGALFGDSLKSFFKRRLNIKPGQPWPPFDQMDFLFGALLFLFPFYQLPWQNFLILLLFTPILHLISNIIGYKLGIKKVWW